MENEHLFKSLPSGPHTLELWRIDYNTQRPHMSFKGLTPCLCQPVSHGPQPRPPLAMIEGNNGAGALSAWPGWRVVNPRSPEQNRTDAPSQCA
jgi:Integrase core domain